MLISLKSVARFASRMPGSESEMTIAYVVLGIASIPAVLIRANLYCSGFREARGIAILLGDEAVLQKVVTKEVLARPSAEAARFAKAPYAASMQAFGVADAAAHAKGRSLTRVAFGATLLASAVVGFLGVGWLGLLLPVINVVVMQSTFVGSTQGVPDQAAMGRSVEHVQIRALILYRWLASDARQASAWLEGHQHLMLLARRVQGLA